MDGTSSNKRQLEAQLEGDSNAKRHNVTMRLETLDCSVCSEPLRPPIFQSSLGHFICLSCRSEILDKKCHLCSAVTSFERCFGMEHVIKSVTVACSNAKYGCAEQIIYYQKEEHEKMCPNAPCFCPESGCGFAGSTMALLGHMTGKHKCPLSTCDDPSMVNVYLYLEPGLRVLHCHEDDQFFLFNMASESFGHAISVVCVQPRVTEPKFTCDLYYDSSTTDDSQNSCCKGRVALADLIGKFWVSVAGCSLAPPILTALLVHLLARAPVQRRSDCSCALACAAPLRLLARTRLLSCSSPAPPWKIGRYTL
ncbi:E3 ubiquitin-protein ligase SINA-like 7 [Aegilops tauschii subsp. strangulata]|uniref:E3 ubiquitin-protein ligase SINA-like 7 n=1 Tax=Aegilops tauschii subsp. strangulata TaxID=200361 RepID=UPI003CC85DD4